MRHQWPILHLRRAGVLRSGNQREAKGDYPVWGHYLLNLPFMLLMKPCLVKEDLLVVLPVK